MWEESFMQWMESVHSHGLDTVMTVTTYCATYSAIWLVDYFGCSTGRYHAIDIALFWANKQLFCADKLVGYSYGICTFVTGYQYVSYVVVRGGRMDRSGYKMVYLGIACGCRMGGESALFDYADEFVGVGCNRTIWCDRVWDIHVYW